MKNEVVKKIISSLPATVPLAILQADHVGKITSEESQPDCRQWRRMQNPTFYFNDLARFFPPVFPLKSVMAKQNLQSWFGGHESTFSPDCWLFSLNQHFFLPTFAFQVLIFRQQSTRPEVSNMGILVPRALHVSSYLILLTT